MAKVNWNPHKIQKIESLDERAMALKDRVLYWQEKLSYLGIGHYWIDRISLVDEPFGEASYAGVDAHFQYDRVTFEFAHRAIDEPRTDYDLDMTIIHEWLHVADRDYDEVIDRLLETLGGQARELMEAQVKSEREGRIDRLARLIVRLYYGIDD